MRGFDNVMKIPELRKKIIYTFGLLAIYRLGGFIPVPGINSHALQAAFADGGGVMGMFDLFVGGAFRGQVFSPWA